MSGLKTRAAAPAVLIAMTIVLAFLAWRGLKAGSAGDIPTELAWREADEEDLF
jgi:formylglycine-generating enzyme required for sulfatase activity